MMVPSKWIKWSKEAGFQSTFRKPLNCPKNGERVIETIKRLNQERLEVALWAILAGSILAGIPAALLLKAPLRSNDLALGTHTLALFIPFVASTSLLGSAHALGIYRIRWLGLSLALFVALSIPLVDILTRPIHHLEGDDSFRYSTYAHNIVGRRTLWGSDDLIYQSGQRSYVDQPGYRYFLAAEIAILRTECRGLQLLNLFLLLVGMAAALHWISLGHSPPDDIRAFAFLTVLASSYMAKNVLYGYTEWFTVLLLFLISVCVIRHKILAALIVLAIIPFIRQNLLLLSLIWALVLLHRARAWQLVFPYLAILFLPIYHNLYYAGEFRFFVTNTGLNLESGIAGFAKLMAIRALNYVGYEPDINLLALAVAVLFVPFGTFLMGSVVLRAGWRRWPLYLLIAAVTIGPTIFFGSGSYPRFVFVNQFAIILACLSLSVDHHKESQQMVLKEPDPFAS